MKKTLTIIIALVLMVTLFCGCTDDTRAQEEAYQETLMHQATAEIGMPEITNFFEKKMAKEIFEKRDDSKLICYAYAYSDMTGKYTYLGKCYGYGLPYSTQYTNPDQLAGEYRDSSVIAQADPNGLYSSGSTAATWLYMIDEETGEKYISYNEPNMTVSEHKLPARLCEEWSLTSDY